MFILNSWSFWSINCLPLCNPSFCAIIYISGLGLAATKEKECSGANPETHCYHCHWCFLFCSGNRMGSDHPGHGPSERDSRMLCNLLRSLPPSMAPALPCFRILLTPHTSTYLPPSLNISPGGSHSFYHLKTIHISMNLWPFQGSVWRRMQHLALFCHLVRYQVCLGFCVWFVPRISTHTPSPLSHELPENRGHVWQVLEFSHLTYCKEIGEESALKSPMSAT